MAACLVVSGASSAARGSAGIVPGKLTCEYQTDPSVVDARHPRLSWINTAAAGLPRPGAAGIPDRGGRYRKSVAGRDGRSVEQRESKSPQSTLVKYAGKPLQSRETCWWRVRVWDGKGNVSAWSEPARWNMGYPRSVGVEMPLDRRAVAGRGVAGGPGQGCAAPGPCCCASRSAWIRRSLRLTSYGTGLGYFELYMNGEKVGDDVLAPNQTNTASVPGSKARNPGRG